MSFILILAMVLLMSTGMTDAQITQPRAWTKAYDLTSGSATGTNFAIAAGSNRLLVVAISHVISSSNTLSDPSVITYGGVTLTKAAGNGTTSGRMHTWLYYLKDNAVMDNTSRPLNVTISSSNLLNLAVWYAVFAGVDQSPASYTSQNGINNTEASGPAQLSSAMTVNANQQAVYISSVYSYQSTTVPAYTININWTSGGSNTGSVNNTGSSNDHAWRVEVANRTIPGSNTTDNAATSSITPAGQIRYAITALSLPKASTLPMISTFSPSNACSGSNQTIIITGNNFSDASTVTFSNGQDALFTVDNSTSITATLPANAVTGQVSITSPSGTGTSPGNFNVTSLPVVSITGNNSICVGNTTTLSPTNGGTWASSDNSVAIVNSAGVVTGISEGSATFRFTQTSTGCISLPTSPVNVQALPVVSISGNNSICVGTTTSLLPSSGGTWTSSNPSIASVTDAGIVTGTGVGTVTFIFKQTSTGCSSLPSSEVTVHPLPVPTFLSGPVTSCPGSTVTYSTEPSMTNYIWVVSSGGSYTLGTTSDIINVTWNAAGPQSVSVTYTDLNGCTAAQPTILPVTIQEGTVTNQQAWYNTSDPLQTPPNLCVGSTLNLHASGGTSYSWTGPNGFKSSDQDPVISDVTLANAGDYYVTATAGCESGEAVVTVTIYSLPEAVTVLGGGSFCNSATITAEGGSGGTIYFQGTTSGGTSISIPSNSEIITESGKYYFQINVSCRLLGARGKCRYNNNSIN